MIASLPAGLHENIPEATYHARVPGLASKHALDLVRRSPRRYRAWLDGADERPTEAMTFGKAFHCALLEPEKFTTRYVVAPDFGPMQSSKNRALRDAWRAENDGVTTLSADDMATLERMAAAVQAHPLASRMLVGGVAESTVTWTDTETGLRCKARPDYYVRSRSMVVDIKTTDNAEFDEFKRSIGKFGYHRQAALYMDGLRAAGLPAEHFVFLAVEKGDPCDCAVYTLDDDSLQRGRDSIRDDLATLADCLRRDTWPGYPATIQTISLPPWAA